MNYRIKLIQWLIHLNERVFFYPKLRKAYLKIGFPESPIIIDVGGNRGQSIDFYISLYPKAAIYSFEPNPKLYQFLLRKYNGLGAIEIINSGASNINGFLSFYENVLDETSTFESINMESKYLRKKANILGVEKTKIFANSYEVEVVKLSDFFRTKGINKVDVLKIDVEGHELAVLQGLFSERSLINIDYIQIENHQDDLYKKPDNYFQIVKILDNHGFMLYKKIRHGFGDFYEEIYFRTK